MIAMLDKLRHEWDARSWQVNVYPYKEFLMRATGIRLVATLFVASKGVKKTKGYAFRRQFHEKPSVIPSCRHVCGANNILVQPQGVLGALLVKNMHDGLLGLLHHLLVTSSSVQGESRITNPQLIFGHRSQHGRNRQPGIWIDNWPAGIHNRHMLLTACQQYGICCLTLEDSV